MKKRKILLGILLATAIFTSASCDGPDKDSDGTKEVVAQQFTVTFDSKGGSTVAAQTVDKDAKATQPTAPTRTATAAETYTFAGWYTDEAYTTAFDFNTGITANITLYAKWTPTAVMYTVTFNTGSGASTVPAASVAYGGTVTKPTDPTKVDPTGENKYAFGGWYKDAGFQTSFDFENDTIKESLILYAKWNPTDKFQVTFNAMGGTPDTQTQLVFDGDTVLEPTTNPTKTEDDYFVYTFGGWYTSTDGGVTLSDTAYDFSTKVTSVLILYAKWNTTEKYLVEFNVNGANETVNSQRIVSGQTATDPQVILTRTEDENYVYEFDGWFVDADCTEEFDFSTPITKATTVYAGWEMTEKYTVTFDIDGVTDTIDLQRIVSGQNATQPETIPTKEADAQYTYTFAYWYAEGTTTAFDFANTPITGDTTLYAKWTETVNKYTVTFDSNGGSEVAAIENVEYGSLIENPGVPTKNADAQYSYTFEYWYVDGLDTPFDFTKDTIAGNLTLCAKWTPVKNKYTVTFDTNGGTTVNPISNVEYGSTITAPTAPTKADDENYTYAFAGWYKDSGLQTSFDFTNDTITAATTLYAKWTPTAIQKYTYTFYNEDGSVVKTETIKEGELIVAPTTNPTKAEDSNFTYSFLGWYDKASAGNKVTIFGAITGDVSYYAQYQGVAKLTVSFVVNQGDQQFESVKVASGSSVTLPTANAIEGYRFDGWYLEDTYETKYTNQAITSATTLYGNYVQQINVTFIADGVEYLVSSIDKGSKVSEPTAPTKDGYYLSSWQLDGVDFDFNTTIDENITLIAVFEEVKETENVGFGGSYTSWQTLFDYTGSTRTYVKDNKTRTYLGPTSDDELITMNGFTFLGKALLDSGVLNTNASVITIQIPNNGSSINMSATWGSSNDYGVIRVYKNGVQIYESSETYSKTNASVTLALSNLSAGTYEIKAEKTNTTGQAGLKVSTIYYSRLVEYVNVSYVGNNNQTIESTQIKKGNTLDSLPTLNDKSGYRFIGWYTTEDFKAGTEFTVPSTISSNTVLYACWEELTAEDIVTVSFVVNVDGQNIDSVDIEKGTKLSALPVLNIEGYRLVGWFTNASLSQAFDIDTYVFTQDTILYADFIEVFDVTFLDQDGVLIKTVTVDTDTKVTAPNVPYIEGYKFDHWVIEGTDTVFDIDQTIAQKYTLRAVYVIDTNPPTKLNITSATGYDESATIKFASYTNSSSQAATSYNIHLNGTVFNNKLLDEKNLYLTTSGNTVTAELFGLKAGTYTLTVAPVYDDIELTAAQQVATFDVTAYDRSGYAHFNNTEGVGAYNDDGTIKDNAIVLYVTDENKNTIELAFHDSVNNKDWSVVGIGNILNSAGKDNGTGTNSKGGLANTNGGVILALAQNNIPLIVRFVGCVSNSGLYKQGTFNANSTPLINGLSQYDGIDWGGSVGDNGHMARMQSGKNITFEGVGNDAIIDGWGFHLICESAHPELAKNFEVRNLTFMNTPEDAVGMEGQETESTQTITAAVEHCWIHHNTFLAPSISSAAESDKSEGDGSCDFKRGRYFTCSYNYFESCHKTNLVGSGKTSVQYCLTYHHNLWYECAARQPLARKANIHFYNNFIIGTSDTVSSLRADAYMYAEKNYYLGCSRPVEYKAEGSTGVCKAYENNVIGCFNNYDATDVTDREATITANCKDNATGINYSTFDTDPTKFYYDSTNKCSDCYLTDADQARIDCVQQSGSRYRTVLGNAKYGTNTDVTSTASSATVSGATSLTIAKGKGILKVFTVTSPVTVSMAATASAGFDTGYLLKMDGTVVLELSSSVQTAVLMPGEYVVVSCIAFTPNAKNDKETTITTCTFAEYDSAELNQQLIDEYNAARDALPTTIAYTDQHYQLIKAAMNAYKKLGTELQAQVTGYYTVTSALADYKAAGELYVKGLIDDIVLPVTASNSSAIITARTAYNALLSRISDASVSNYATLVEAESQMSSLAVDIFLTNANAIPATIDYTNECNTLITNAEVAYANLDENQVKQSEVVTAYAKVTAARATYDNLEAATSVTALIAAANSVATYEAAYNAYNELTADQKALVQGYDSMVVNYTIALINAISSPVTAADAVTINKARAVYDALSSENKADVTNYNVLVAAEEELASVVQEYTKTWNTTEGITAKTGTTADGYTFSSGDKAVMKIKNSSSQFIKLDNIDSTSVTINFTGQVMDTDNAINGCFVVEYSDGTTENITFTFNAKKASTTVTETINNGKTVKSVSFVGSTDTTGKNIQVTSISITYTK